MCHLFDDNKTESVSFEDSIFRLLKIYLYKVYFEDSKVRHDKDLHRRLVQCSICGSLFVQQITDKDIRYIEVKSEKEADKLAKSLKDDDFSSRKHNMIVVEEPNGDKAVRYLRKGRKS